MVRAVGRTPSERTRLAPATASLDEVDAAFLDAIRRVEDELYRRQIDRQRTREVIDLVSNLLSAEDPPAPRSLRGGPG